MPDGSCAGRKGERVGLTVAGRRERRALPGSIAARDLRSMLHDGGELALLDVREAGQFGESHLLNATPLPYSRLELDVDALVPCKSVRMVLCDDGELGVAPLAARRLRAMGYTNIAVLDGGTKAWAAEGQTLFAGVNVLSKTFGEWVENVYRTPRISVHDLAALQAAGEDMVILDGRPYPEYQRMTIPGALCCPNGELPYRVSSMVRNPKTRVVVNCAGRTRSIIGAQTLINFGIPNPVYALENGTQGWFLADFKLEHGAARRYPGEIDPASIPALQVSAKRLMARFAITSVTASEVETWLRDPVHTTYLCDVRTPEEFNVKSIRGAAHAPGGQLLQATDQWIGVRNARIVLIDGEGVRAPVVAAWLRQMGLDVYVLEGGVRSGLCGPSRPDPPLPALNPVAAPDLHRMLGSGGCRVFDLRGGMAFRSAHIPGSRWSIRPRLAEAARGAQGIVLVADDPGIACCAALDLFEAGHRDLRILEDGLKGWIRAGHATETSPAVPPDAECIDYLFFVHDRHAGNKDAIRRYLAWETGLLSQLDEADRQRFRLVPS